MMVHVSRKRLEQETTPQIQRADNLNIYRNGSIFVSRKPHPTGHLAGFSTELPGLGHLVKDP